jgi:hypothetical protein
MFQSTRLYAFMQQKSLIFTDHDAVMHRLFKIARQHPTGDPFQARMKLRR